MSLFESWLTTILRAVITEKQVCQPGCRSCVYSACMRCRKVETQKGWVEPDRAEVGGFPSSDSGLKGVCVLPRGPLKPIITVFCQKLKANQGGGEEGLHLPVTHSLTQVYPLRWRWLYRGEGVFAQTSCGAERDTSRVSCCDLYKGWRRDADVWRSCLPLKRVRVFVFGGDPV